MYDVIWVPSTMEDLAQIWLDAQAADRQRITQAVSLIDRELTRRASEVGESRDEERRVHFEPPLGIIYRVSEEHRVAVIARVWRYSEYGDE